MARRSDHTRSELRALFVSQGHKLMAEKGFASFSAREVARNIGYSIGTLYNVFGTLDHFLSAINSRTFALWHDFLKDRLERGEDNDRIAVLVDGYFEFAHQNRNCWMAIYDHRLPDIAVLDEADRAIRERLTELIEQEVCRALPEQRKEEASELARSLIALVHGHCIFDLNGSFALMNIAHPRKLALARVDEALGRG